MSDNSSFVQGYYNVHLVRVLQIVLDDGSSSRELRLHPSQDHLWSEQIEGSSCLVANGFAVIIEGQDVSKDLQAQCTCKGRVMHVFYAMVAIEFDGTLRHLGDVPSSADARAVVRNMVFDIVGQYRCLRISSADLSAEAKQYLTASAHHRKALFTLFDIFRMRSGEIGIRLIGTPWTDKNLQSTWKMTAHQLRHAQLFVGVPATLVDLLHKAAASGATLLVYEK
jgi:hypothetical protein